MISIYRYPEGVTLNPREYLLDKEGNVLRFKDIPSARTFLTEKGADPNAVHYEIEDSDEELYYDVVESMELAFKPYIGKVLTKEIIETIKEEMYDAVSNNKFE